MNEGQSEVKWKDDCLQRSKVGQGFDVVISFGVDDDSDLISIVPAMYYAMAYVS